MSPFNREYFFNEKSSQPLLFYVGTCVPIFLVSSSVASSLGSIIVPRAQLENGAKHCEAFVRIHLERKL